MATRLYFHAASNNLSGTFPTNHQSAATADWTATGATTLRKMDGTIGTGQTSQTGTTSGTTAAQDGFLGFFVSKPLNGNQTVGGGTITLNTAEAESNASANFWINTLNVYVWRPSNGTKVGTLRDAVGTALNGNEPTSNNTEQVSQIGATSSGVSALDGDVIICEVWSTHSQAMNSQYTGTFYYDGTTVSTTENATVSNHASFVELAETLSFQATVYTASYSATNTATPTKLSSVDLIRNFSATATISKISQVGKIFSQSITGTATYTAFLSYMKDLSASITATPTYTKIASFIRSLSQSVTVTPTKISSVNLSRVSTVSSIATRLSDYLLSKAATLSETITMTKLAAYQKVLSASRSITATTVQTLVYMRNLATTVTANASRVNQVGKVLTQTVSSVATRVSNYFLSKAVSVTATITRTSLRALLSVLSASRNVSATSVRVVNKITSATKSVTATMTKLAAYVRALTNSVTITPSYFRNISKSFNNTKSITATRLSTRFREFTVTVSNAATFTKLIMMNKFASLTSLGLNETFNVIFVNLTASLSPTAFRERFISLEKSASRTLTAFQINMYQIYFETSLTIYSEYVKLLNKVANATVSVVRSLNVLYIPLAVFIRNFSTQISTVPSRLNIVGKILSATVRFEYFVSLFVSLANSTMRIFARNNTKGEENDSTVLGSTQAEGKKTSTVKQKKNNRTINER